MTDNLTFNQVKPSNLSRQSIQQLADQVRRDLDGGSVQDLENLVEKLGGEISYVDLYEENGFETSGTINITGFMKFTIFVANHTNTLRDRFTIAHEIGHYILHYLYPTQIKGESLGCVKAARRGNQLAETEANWFAACLLMPEENYREEFEKTQNYIAIAKHFKVSSRASYYRAKGLGLI